MASDTSTVAYIFMRKYADGEISDASTRDHPLSRMIDKETALVGESYRYFVKYGNPAAVGGTFSTTQGDAATSKGVQFSTTPGLKYGVIVIDGPSMARATNQGAKVDLVTNETDGVLEEMYDHLAFDAYRDGNGIRGRRSSASTNVITLVTADDARNFKVGMTVGASANADGSSPRTGDTTVASVDEDSGTVTLTSAAAITSFADNDYMFVAGDPGTCVDGLAKFFPLTAPTAGDSFRSVDRSVHVNLLAGSRIDNTSAPIEENVGLAAVKIGLKRKMSGKLVGFANPINVWQVVRRQGAKIEYDGGGGGATYGFEYINVATPEGVVRLYSDPDCPTNRGYVLDLGPACFMHTQPYVHIIRDDGRPSLRQTSADAIEVRARSMSQPIFYDPSKACVFSI